MSSNGVCVKERGIGNTREKTFYLLRTISTKVSHLVSFGILSGLVPRPLARCKAPDAVLTQVSRFRVRPELEAHKRPPMHDTRTRVAIGFSSTDIRSKTLY